MEPIKELNNLLDQAEKKIGHSLHPAIVEVPVGAWTVSVISDVLGAITRDRAYDDAASVSMAVGLAGAAGAVVTGLRDYSYIPRSRPSHDIATRHAIGNAAVGALFATSYILRASRAKAGRRPGFIARLLGLGGGSLMVYTAWLGGKLVFEHGEAVKPVMERLEAEESGTLHDQRAQRTPAPAAQV
jgi:uncharacterized membrane protein